jgi:choloylglycine hydrolase
MKFLTFLFVSIGSIAQLSGCTGILMQAKDLSAVNGRTVEFGIPLDVSLAVIPRNISFTGKTPMGPGMAYQSKYAAVGAYCFEDPVLMDGMNEKGLAAAAFYFPGYAKYAEVTQETRARALSPADFPHWVLTQFATIEEVKEALSSVVIAPTILEGWGNEPPPMHYIVYDSSGKSIVIEPIDGDLKVYDNEIGVITNSPSFDWHLTNLNNYINLTPFNAGPRKLGNWNLNPFGQGTGMLGLPGDFSPPSRFVRAAFFLAAALPSKSGDEAVEQAFHLLNQFDIPLGTVRQIEQNKIGYDYTLFTTVKNTKTLEYFYLSYENQTIQFVDLRRFDFNAKEIKRMKIQGNQKKIDVSSQLR